MTAWIGSVFESDVGWDHLEALVDVGNRMAGSEGEREAAELTRDALADVGARDARLESFDIQGWTRGDSAITAGDTTQDCIALPRSPSDRVVAPLIDLGYGLPADFEERDVEDAVVMVRSDVPDYYDRHLHRREKYYHAVENGAVGFVYRNHVEGCLPRPVAWERTRNPSARYRPSASRARSGRGWPAGSTASRSRSPSKPISTPRRARTSAPNSVPTSTSASS